MKALLLALLIASLSATGCIGKKDLERADDAPEVIDEAAQQRLAERAAPVPRSYSFPGQESLPPQLVYFNGSVDASSATAYEDRNDRGGNSYNALRERFDLSPYVPPGQPFEMRITLFYEGKPGQSADLDIFVDVPGMRTERATDNGDEFNWKFSVQRMVVNSLRVPSQPLEVGVQIANGKTASDWSYALRVDLTFVEDVIAPGVPWAFRLPDDASGIALSAMKAGGDEHVHAKVLVIDEDDQPVHFLDFNDIDIPTESVFLPLAGGREYVAYAVSMQGGFLRLDADVPVPERDVRALATREERVVVSAAPAPGAGARDWLHDGTLVTPGAGGGEATWPAQSFPLSISPFIEGAQGLVGWGEIRIASSKGEVAWLQRVARHDDERGSLGYTSDAWNSARRPENLTRSVHNVWFADANPGAQIGFVATTLARDAG